MLTGQVHEILLVEDNPDDIELTLHALKRNNILNPIVVARDGQEALDYLFAEDDGEPRHDKPALILLDLKLPRVDGIEVLRAIKASSFLKNVPVVILTSSKEDRDLVESYALGVNSYIRKPVDFDQFVETVRYIGYYWLLLNEAPDEEG